MKSLRIYITRDENQTGDIYTRASYDFEHAHSYAVDTIEYAHTISQGRRKGEPVAVSSVTGYTISVPDSFNPSEIDAETLMKLITSEPVDEDEDYCITDGIYVPEYDDCDCDFALDAMFVQCGYYISNSKLSNNNDIRVSRTEELHAKSISYYTATAALEAFTQSQLIPYLREEVHEYYRSNLGFSSINATIRDFNDQLEETDGNDTAARIAILDRLCDEIEHGNTIIDPNEFAELLEMHDGIIEL